MYDGFKYVWPVRVNQVLRHSDWFIAELDRATGSDQSVAYPKQVACDTDPINTELTEPEFDLVTSFLKSNLFCFKTPAFEICSLSV